MSNELPPAELRSRGDLRLQEILKTRGANRSKSVRKPLSRKTNGFVQNVQKARPPLIKPAIKRTSTLEFGLPPYDFEIAETDGGFADVNKDDGTCHVGIEVSGYAFGDPKVGVGKYFHAPSNALMRIGCYWPYDYYYGTSTGIFCSAQVAAELVYVVLDLTDDATVYFGQDWLFFVDTGAVSGDSGDDFGFNQRNPYLQIYENHWYKITTLCDLSARANSSIFGGVLAGTTVNCQMAFYVYELFS